MKLRYERKTGMALYNRLTTETVVGDIINEEEIDGKRFFVVQIGQRILKLSKDAYTAKKTLLPLFKD